ncbi:MAG TPA: serine hydrolase [Candidatus Sulfotelmatobacter sp.]|jgi:D-alanyl-D-alanine carboxypeptidase|nr:serine hydrolase [Candidatus Sulfotelmatobacter sp.]
MKHSESAIWQKKRQRKFKKSKPSQAPAKKTVISQHISPKKKEAILKKSSIIQNFFMAKKAVVKKEKEKRVPNPVFGYVKRWLHEHDSDVQLILFPLILLIILITLSIFNNQIFLAGVPQEPVVNDQITTLNPYPFVQAVNSPTISAKAAIILDRGSQVILFSKNPQLRFSMASTTKIMTALVALDYYKLDDILTVKRSGVQGSGLNLYPGEQFKYIDLMYAMLLPSANDAAQAIADNYPGGSDEFVKKMNEKAQSLHLSNTHYADPIGLNDDGDYSTVVDMARLASFAISNPIFVEVTSTKYRTMYASNFGVQYPLTNLNKLLGIDGVTGIKTGTTEGAGEVLVTSVVKNGHTYLIVVMDSVDRFLDTSMLLNFIDSNVKYIVPSVPARR